MSRPAAFLRSFGAYLPERVVPNQELADRLGCEPDWILRMSGVEQRHLAAPDETVADMATAAGRECLSAAGEVPSQVGMLIVASGTGERRFPGPAAAVAHKLGLSSVPALDLPVASAGAIFGLSLASRLAATVGNVLVIAADKMGSVVLDAPADPRVAILFGDGAGSCLISPSHGPARVVGSTLASDGGFGAILQLPLAGGLQMDGPAVFLQASRRLPRCMSALLQEGGVGVGEVGTFLLHQANRNLTVQLARTLGVPEERFFSNIDRCANTSAASLLIAARDWARDDGFREGVPVMFAALGAGLHWGALLAIGNG